MSSINLGPYNVNKPTVDEKANIRESLGLFSASLLNATFNQNGSELTIADPTIPTNTITFDKNRLTSNIADSLSASQTFSVSGDVTTTTERSFNGTQAVNIPVTINAGAINTVKLAEGSVIASKISNGNITPEKLSAGGPVWTGNTFFTTTNTAAIGNAVAGAISLKLGNNRSGAGSSNIEFTTSTVADAINSSIVRATDTNGAFSITNFGTGNFTLSQTENAPLIFSTANTERMRISATGAVGIGKDPTTLLDVNGVITATRYDGKISSSALVSGGALEVTVDNLLQIKDLGVTTAKLENSTSLTTGITTAKLASGAVTQAKLGTNVAGNGPLIYATTTVATSVPTGLSATKITLGTKNFDTNNNFNTTLSRFTPTVAGYYQINVSVSIATGANALTAYVFKNGINTISGNAVNATTYASTNSIILYCNGSTDYIELFATHTQGSNVNITGAMNACLIRSA
jgi:hypothetical protein